MTLWNDLRIAARTLVKDPGLTLAAVTALSLGIAANTTVFTIVNGALFRDLPFDEPDRIAFIGTRLPQGARGVSYPDLEDWRQRTRAFEGLAAFSQSTMNVGDDERSAERFPGAYISANAFALIGHRPASGRPFSPDDERPGAQPVVMLGHSVWTTRYQSDPAVLGRTIRVNGIPSVVIGVMADGFRFPFRAELWQPITLMSQDVLTRRDARTLDAVGRLRPGITRDQARDDLALVMAGLVREYPLSNGADLQPRVTDYRELGVGTEVRLVMYALLGAVAFVLLIACANVANLLLARAAGRAREISVRMAVGASRGQIVRQLLVESVLLACAAGVVGLGLSIAGVRMFVRAVTGTGEPYWLQFTLDPLVFAAFAAVCLGAAVVFGLAPALHTSNVNVAGTLNESGRGSAGTVRVRQWSSALVVLQLALAPVLLTGAGLMMRTLLAQYQQDMGVATSGLVRLRLDLPNPQYPTPERRAQFYRQLDERLATAGRAALAASVPGGGVPLREIAIDGRPVVAGDARPTVSMMTIGPRYFDAMGTAPARGRAFTEVDGTSGDVAAVVNTRFVALHFPDEDPIGRRVRLTPVGGPPAGPLADPMGDAWVTIVGVAPNIRQRNMEDRSFDPIVYVPYTSNPVAFSNILIRSREDAGAVAARLRAEVQAIDPDLPVFDVMTVDEILSFERWPLRVFGGMFTAFAIAAFLMASVGLYGVTARSVAQRTREIGVRVALGAQSREIWWLVTRRASIQLGIGLVVGMAGAVAAARLLQGLLIQVSTTDPLTIIGVTLLLVLVGLGASLIPARRAMRLDPVVALRHE